MSINLTLIKYDLDSKQRYLEDSGEVIATSFIAEDILQTFREMETLATLDIYEEVGSDKFSETDCLQNEKIPEILVFVKSKFIELFEITKVSITKTQGDELVEAMSIFRSITNLYFLLETKCKKYKSDDTVIIKLG